MKLIRKFLEWSDDINDSIVGDILVWVLFVANFVFLWLFTYMIAG